MRVWCDAPVGWFALSAPQAAPHFSDSGLKHQGSMEAWVSYSRSGGGG